MPNSTSSSFVTRRPVAVLMLFLAAVVFGALSYRRLPVTLMPELSYPTLTVRTEVPGAAPEEVENDVSRRLEEALGVVSGLRRMSSISRAGVSDVVLEFAWDVDMADAVQDTLEKLDLVLLPNEAERPLILRFDPTLDPVMELSLSGSGERFTGEKGLRRLRRIADLQVKRALEPIKGVAAVRVRGGLEEEIHVLLDAERLRRSRLSIQQVIDRLRQENINVAGGTLKEGRTEYMVRTVGEYRSLAEMRDTVVAEIDGREVRLGDLGTVELSHKERQILTRTDGGESVQLDLYKEADANMVDLSRRIRERVGEVRPDGGRESPRGFARLLRRDGKRKAPELAAELREGEGADLRIVADRSRFIEGSIDEVRNTAILGGLLAVLVLYLFLRDLVSTLFVALSIPISLLITFAPLSGLGVSLNIMSLGGLALGVGMLVDSSIVVLESIFRCREEGDDLVTAAVRGTAEVRSAVVASTLTSIAVFFPMVFVEGIAGQAFGDLGLAVVISLLASLAVAVYFIPMLASRPALAGAGSGASEDRKTEAQPRPSFVSSLAPRSSLAAWSRDVGRLGSWRRKPPRISRTIVAGMALPLLALRWVVGTVLELAGLLVLAIVAAVARLLRRHVLPVCRRFVRAAGRGPLELADRSLQRLTRIYPIILRRALRRPAWVLLVVLSTLAASAWLLLRLDTELLPEVHQGEVTVDVTLPVGTPLEETVRILTPVEEALLAEHEHVKELLLTYGFDPATSQRSDEGENTARFKLLIDSVLPEIETEVTGRLRRRLASIPDAEVRVSRPVLFSFKTPIEVEVYGDELAELRSYGRRVEDLLRVLPELDDVETTLRRGAPEVQISYDRDRLLRYGLELATVAAQVRDQVKGYEATLYNLKDRRIPIVVRLEEDDRRSTEDLSRLVINPAGERAIPLSAIAAVSLGEGPSEIRRVDSRRVALVRANLGDASLGTAVERIRDVLEREVEWPEHVSYRISGQSEEWEQSRGSLWLALALSIFLVYVIMAAQFESLIHPLVIMFTIPLALFGTVALLNVLGMNLSIVVFLGMIMLAGIVVNNAIVLVDYINTLKARGLPHEEAIVTAGAVRLRPILMTTATTVLGLLPMALGLGEGAEIRTPMAVAVIGGLLTSTVLTLVVVPVVYHLAEAIRLRLAALARGERGRSGAARHLDLDEAGDAGLGEGRGSARSRP